MTAYSAAIYGDKFTSCESPGFSAAAARAGVGDVVKSKDCALGFGFCLTSSSNAGIGGTAEEYPRSCAPFSSSMRGETP